MAQTRRDWRTDMDTIRREMERLLDHYAGSKPPMIQFAKQAWEPAVDVYETADHLVIIVDLAGIDQDHLQIIADRSTVAIRGERSNPGSGTRRTYYQMEIDSGAFERVISLPVTIDSEHAKARYRDGMLEIIASKTSRRPAGRAYVRIFHARETDNDE